jgi:hypothetical protein
MPLNPPSTKSPAPKKHQPFKTEFILPDEAAQSTGSNGNKGKNEVGKNDPSNLESLQKEVDEIAGIMHSNIEKVISRGEDINKIFKDGQDLKESAISFKKTSNTIKSQM